MKYAICNETYVNWSLEKTCEDIASHGFKGVEVAPFTLNENPINLTENEALNAGKIIRSFGLQPIGLHWLLAKTTNLHITSPDSSMRQRTKEFLKKLIELNAVMGGEILVFGSPMCRNLENGTTYEEGLKRAIEIFQDLTDDCKKYRSIIAIEPLARKETNFIYTAQQGIQICKTINSPYIKLHLDVKAMSDEDKPIPDIIRESAAWLTHFHANDPNLKGPGTGAVKYEGIYEALFEINYDKWISIEVFNYEPNATAIAREGIAYLKVIENKVKALHN